MNRCTCKGSTDYERYKGLLCEEWKVFTVFDKYMSDPVSDDLTIDRIDNDRGYEPGNVRWITMAEQHRNQSNCRWIDYDGRTQLLTDWEKEFDCSYAVINNRIKRLGVKAAFDELSLKRKDQ